MTEKNGELKCEGGKLECSGHRVQACVIDKDRNDVVKYLGNIAVRILAAEAHRSCADTVLVH